MLEADPGSREIVDFGIAFYGRLLAQSDAALAAAKNFGAAMQRQARNGRAQRRPTPAAS